jgi:hypothetical protein
LLVRSRSAEREWVGGGRGVQGHQCWRFVQAGPVCEAGSGSNEESGESDDLPTGERFDESDYPQLTATARRADELSPLPDEPADLIATCLAPEAARRLSVPELLSALEPIAQLPPRERRHE